MGKKTAKAMWSLTTLGRSYSTPHRKLAISAGRI